MSDTDIQNAPAEAEEDYGASSISVMKGLEAVRKRPGMYIGDPTDGSGLHHMPQEIIDNSVDEAQAGFATKVTISINPDNSVTVADDGRGIPVDIHPEEGISATELVLTKLHAGGKFNQNSYKVSGGLHGVGAAVVNALSEWMTVEVVRDGGRYSMSFHRGDADAPLERIGDAAGHGTTITFLPDRNIFGNIALDGERVLRRVRELACLNPGIRFVYSDLRNEDHAVYDMVYNNGVSDLLDFYIDGRKTMLPEGIRLKGEREITIAEPDGTTRTAISTADVALNWINDDPKANVWAFTNNIFQNEGGTHVQGARIALSNAFRSLIQKTLANSRRKIPDITVDDLWEGISIVVSIKFPEPTFSSQTKGKLTSAEAQRVTGSVVSEGIQEWIDRNPSFQKIIVDHVLEAAEARIAAREASRRSREKRRSAGEMDQACIPGKLTDCESRNPEECELFLVEGDSAGGTAKNGRDNRIQAILPLKGKILNTETVTPQKIVKSAEVGTIIRALGVGGIGSGFDLDGLRYHKIVIMTDADVDGSHIRTLLMTFFYRHMRPLVDNGHLYIAQAPLYSVDLSKTEKKYILDDAEFETFIASRAADAGYYLETVGEDGNRVRISGDELVDVALKVRDLNVMIGQWLRSQKYPDISENLLCADLLNPVAFQPENIEKATQVLLRHMQDVSPESIWSISDLDRENGAFSISWRRRGVTRTASFSADEILHDGLLQKILNSEGYDLIPLFQSYNQTKFGGPDKDFDVRNASGFLKMIDVAGRHGLGKISRFKGLGEMNDKQLWDTTLDPQNRILLQVRVEDDESTNSVFANLMGKSSRPRKQVFLKSMGADIEEAGDDEGDIGDAEDVDANEVDAPEVG